MSTEVAAPAAAGYSFGPSEDQQLVREAIRQFADEQLMPGALERDKGKLFAREQWDAYRELGFAGMTVPEQYGGTPLDPISESIVIEELSRCDASFGVLVAVHSGLFGKTLMYWGSEEQKALWGPKLANGEVIGAYSLSEAGSGSDATAMS